MEGNWITYKCITSDEWYCQGQGIVYDITFSSLSLLKSIGMLRAMATHSDMRWQMDMIVGFLERNLVYASHKVVA